MNSDFDGWERRRRENEARWGDPRNLPFRSYARGFPSPGHSPRSPYSYAPRSRPSSSGNDQRFPSSPFSHVRSGSFPHSPQLEEFRMRRRWPPIGHTRDSALSPREADEIIVSGVSTFKGYVDELKLARGNYRFFVVMESEHYRRTDAVAPQADAFKDVSLSITGEADRAFPWMALEQPPMLFAFGKEPGTTTLTFRTSKFGSPRAVIQLHSHARPKKMKLSAILEKLMNLERGLPEGDETELYDSLYGTVINDPDADKDPHYGMERQITDLIAVLSNREWVDFSERRNQVVAKYFDSNELDRKKKFFHQLLLSIELYLRIHANQHHESAKRQLLLTLPPKIGWDMAVAQRWLENMSITKADEEVGTKAKTFSFELRSKKRQRDALRRFATILKWPNIEEVNETLDEEDSLQKRVEDRSADAMSWFTGVILPGSTLPWLLMNSLIDCDDGTGEILNFLTHMKPSAGFQYRANSYWSYQCIVGKVLGAAWGVNEVAGWIGPCNYSSDLKKTECALIRASPALDARVLATDVQTIAGRTLPLGPEADEYPIRDYDLPKPDTDDVADNIRIERLCFNPVKGQRPPVAASTTSDGENIPRPLTWEASIVFAFSSDNQPSTSHPLKLRYDVDFIAAFPCHQGPHVLFWDYAYRCVRVDEDLVNIKDWAAQNQPKPRRGSTPSMVDSGTASGHNSGRASPSETSNLPNTSGTSVAADGTKDSDAKLALAAPLQPAFTGLDTVLVIEAMGVNDNEVFARAWCAQWGVSALVARVGETCMACAIREAYAACVSVVILTEGRRAAVGERAL